MQVSQTEYINELGLRVAGGVRIGEPDSFTDVSRRSENLEDHYRKMIKENPNNPLFLRNYAKFLSEVKYISCPLYFSSEKSTVLPFLLVFL